MTVSSTINKSTYIADGVTTVFAYNWLLPSVSDMEVWFENIEQPSGWTVLGAGDPNGGTVTFDVAPVDQTEITLLRSIAIDQEMDLRPYDPFPADTVEDAFDKLTLICQDIQEQVDRSLKAAPGEEDPDALLAAINQAVIDSEASAAAAGVSETNAAASESAAAGSEAAAAQSAIDAANSAAGADGTNPITDMAFLYWTGGADTVLANSVRGFDAISVSRGITLTGDNPSNGGTAAVIAKTGYYRVNISMSFLGGPSPAYIMEVITLSGNIKLTTLATAKSSSLVNESNQTACETFVLLAAGDQIGIANGPTDTDVEFNSLVSSVKLEYIGDTVDP